MGVIHDFFFIKEGKLQKICSKLRAPIKAPTNHKWDSAPTPGSNIFSSWRCLANHQKFLKHVGGAGVLRSQICLQSKNILAIFSKMLYINMLILHGKIIFASWSLWCKSTQRWISSRALEKLPVVNQEHYLRAGKSENVRNCGAFFAHASQNSPKFFIGGRDSKTFQVNELFFAYNPPKFSENCCFYTFFSFWEAFRLFPLDPPLSTSEHSLPSSLHDA